MAKGACLKSSRLKTKNKKSGKIGQNVLVGGADHSPQKVFFCFKICRGPKPFYPFILFLFFLFFFIPFPFSFCLFLPSFFLFLFYSYSFLSLVLMQMSKIIKAQNKHLLFFSKSLSNGVFACLNKQYDSIYIFIKHSNIFLSLFLLYFSLNVSSAKFLKSD